MPARRKRTKLQQARRKRPALPEGDLETSMNDEERRQKLEVYLQDFDVQVKSRIIKMRSQANSLNSMIKNAYKLEILKLPPNIRKMKVVDYLAQGGKVNDTALQEASKIVTNMTDAVFQNAPRAPLEDVTNVDSLQTPARSTRKKKAKPAEVTEPASTGRALRSTRKRKNVAMSPSCKAKSKAQKVDDSAMPPPQSTTRTTRSNASKVNNQFVTPAATGRGKLQTLFVTPKFDPRLPVTPALLREPKAGERIMSMSGSPLANSSALAHTPQVFIPIGNGKTFQFSTECHLSPSQAPSLSERARKNVELLQEQLSRLLKVPSQLTKK
ncbi:borealin-like [Actinia tenebrosa]|uniref:Borealin-like n=1 Tax=Actinia tenebrosa TaxID=6105 RepID=A0A6P8HWN8_ACTTE|nr:borealin-like [Actinia tenebrosa]